MKVPWPGLHAVLTMGSQIRNERGAMIKPVTERDIDFAIACTFPASDPIALHCDPEEPLDVCSQAASGQSNKDPGPCLLAAGTRLVDVVRDSPTSSAQRLAARPVRSGAPGRNAQGPEDRFNDTDEARVQLSDAIRRRAYELYEQRQRDGRPGDAVADWARAESDMRDIH